MCISLAVFTVTITNMETLSPEQQLRQVEQDYQKRRQAALETESEHESMSRVAEEKIQQHEPSFQASSHLPMTTTDALPADGQAKVQQWVSEAFTKGVWHSIKTAKDSGDMALLDAFHAALTGELYDQLVARKQLKQVA